MGPTSAMRCLLSALLPALIAPDIIVNSCYHRQVILPPILSSLLRKAQRLHPLRPCER